MSVIVKGMEMPKNCEECKFCWKIGLLVSYCPIIDEQMPFTVIDHRSVLCPLVEVMDYPQVNGITPTVIKEET